MANIVIPVEESKPSMANNVAPVEETICIYRVPDYLRSFSPDHFKPMEWRLGLHTHSKLRKTARGLDIFKVEVARMLARGPHIDAHAASSSQIGPGTSVQDLMASATWLDLLQDLKLDLKKAEATYDGRTVLPRPTASLAIDALFLCAYLQSVVYRNCWGYEFRKVFRDSRFEARRYPLYRDLLILDNQVPMPLLLAVIRHLTKAEALRGEQNLTDAELDRKAQETLNRLLLDVVASVYPFNHGVELDLESQVLSHHLAENFSIDRGRDDQLWSPDALWKREHILAAAYIGICGAYKPEADSDGDTDAEVSRPSDQSCSSKCGAWCRRGKGKKRRGDSQASYRNRYRVPSATSLRRSGVKFKVTEASLRLEDIKFDNHTLLLPKLVMHDHTATCFRNLALYEQLQLHEDARAEFRTYLLLMSSLVHNDQDVRLLIENNVLVNHLSNDEAAARDWNGMCEGLFIPANPPKYWTKLQERIRMHDKAKHNRWMADFRTANCADPWRIIAFTLACLITFATFVQAALSIASYKW